jgi:glutamate 5-kinase
MLPYSSLIAYFFQAIKIGTSSLLSDAENCTVNLRALASLAESVRRLKDAGHPVIVISSGAVGAGCQKLGLKSRPDDVSVLQALAAVGQVHLMRFYEDLFSAVGLTCSQVLLTSENLADRDQYKNAQATFRQLLNFGVIPIVNENDCVAVEHDRIGDNDTLSAQVATLVQAEWLFLLTDVDALYTSNPAVDPNATPIREVADMAELLRVDTSCTGTSCPSEGGDGDGNGDVSGDSDSSNDTKVSTSTIPESGTQWGTGGMATKLTAANVATAAGTRMVICIGDPDLVPRVVLDKEQIGTVFLPAPAPVQGFKRWILSAPTRGQISLTNEAEEALRSGTGQLTVDGVSGVEGEFSSGDAVVLKSEDGAEVGRGLVECSAEDTTSNTKKTNTFNIVVSSGNLCLLPSGATPTTTTPSAVSEIADDEEDEEVVAEEEMAKNDDDTHNHVVKKDNNGKMATKLGEAVFPACSTSSVQSMSLVSSSSAGGSGVLDPSGFLEEDGKLVGELEMAAEKLISMSV